MFGLRGLFKSRSDGRAGDMAWDAETPPPDLVEYGIAMSLDARKADRVAKYPARSEASLKGWRTRRGG